VGSRNRRIDCERRNHSDTRLKKKHMHVPPGGRALGDLENHMEKKGGVRGGALGGGFDQRKRNSYSSRKESSAFLLRGKWG